MVRIVGTNIPDEKQVAFALSYIYGIGHSLTVKILAQTKIIGSKKAKDLTPEEINKLREVIEKNYIIEGDLKRKITLNIKRLRDIKSYRGTRHIKSLPVRGQRTKTNSRTRRGNVRRTMGSGKRKMEKK